jgi:hypothetical protein
MRKKAASIFGSESRLTAFDEIMAYMETTFDEWKFIEGESGIAKLGFSDKCNLCYLHPY